MAIVTRDEFATLCGKPKNYINVYIGRNKINTYPGNKKMIDTEDPLNVIFRKNLKRTEAEKVESRRAEKRERKVQSAAPKETATKEETEEIKKELQGEIEKLYGEIVKKVHVPISGLKDDPDSDDEEESEEENWTLRKKIADTLKAEKAAEKESLAVDKMMGNLMPTDMVERIIKVNIGHIYKTMEAEAINLASVYCDILAGGDRAALADIVAAIRNNLQRIVKDTEITALKEVENVIDEYSETRNRGERK